MSTRATAVTIARATVFPVKLLNAAPVFLWREKAKMSVSPAVSTRIISLPFIFDSAAAFVSLSMTIKAAVSIQNRIIIML